MNDTSIVPKTKEKITTKTKNLTKKQILKLVLERLISTTFWTFMIIQLLALVSMFMGNMGWKDFFPFEQIVGLILGLLFGVIGILKNISLIKWHERADKLEETNN